MTEREKMQKQLLYDANYDKEILAERVKAKELCYDYNQLRPSDKAGQQELMRRLLGKTKGEFLHHCALLVRLRLQHRDRGELLCQSQYGHPGRREGALRG